MKKKTKQENIDTETLIAWGGAVKALGDGKVGGYLVRFTTEDDPDLEMEFFNSDTDYGDAQKSATYYNHGLDAKLEKRNLGSGELKMDDVGIWIEAQLELRDEYEEAVYELVKRKKLGWSSGTASHLVERVPMKKATWIAKWPLGLDATLTPMPAEPRNEAIPLKSWQPEELIVTLAERMEMLNAELKVLHSDLDELVDGIDKPLTGKKRKELSELLELCSGLDAVRSNIEQVLAAEPQPKLVASRLIGYKMAEAEKRLKAKQLIKE